MTNAAKPAVLCVGRLYCDLIFTGLPRLPSLGTEVFTDGFGAHAGGGAFITAAHLSALGHGAALAAMLPASPFADLMRDDLEHSGVDLSLSASLPETAGPQLTVAMAMGGERAFLTRRSGPAIPSLSAGDLARYGFGHLHIGELTSLIENPGILGLARSCGMTVSLDCAWDDTLSADALRSIAGHIDVFFPNKAEWTVLCQSELAETIAPLTVVKRGRDGAQALSAMGTLDAPTEPIDAVDSTGAGDAFNAGFLSEWLAGADIRDCLKAGNARGAFAVRRRGGFVAQPSDPLDAGLASQ